VLRRAYVSRFKKYQEKLESERKGGKMMMVINKNNTFDSRKLLSRC